MNGSCWLFVTCSTLGADPFYFNPRPPNQPPQIGVIPPLEVRDNAGPTPLPIP